MSILNSYQRARILLISASAICFLLFWELGRLFHIPAHTHYQDAILQQPGAILDFVVIALAVAVCTAIGTLFAGMVRFNGGLVAACLGLCALSLRGGSSRASLFWADAQGNIPGLFLRLCVEIVVLGGIITGVSWILRGLYLSGKLRDREGVPQTHHTPELGANQLTSLGVQTLATLLLVMFLIPVEAKFQVLVGVFIAGWGGSVVAHQLFPTNTSAWYFLPPLVVGLIGYAIAWFNPDGAGIGSLSGSFAALARPLPLDYASVGTAAAILGHWMSRRWQKERELEAAQNAQG